MEFRFIHTADIHLDSPLKGLAGYHGGAAARIRMATRDAFDTLVGQAIDEEVSFFIVAGDLYDGDWRDYQTGLFFVGQMGRLAKAAPPCQRRLKRADKHVLEARKSAPAQCYPRCFSVLLTVTHTLPAGVKSSGSSPEGADLLCFWRSLRRMRPAASISATSPNLWSSVNVPRFFSMP